MQCSEMTRSGSRPSTELPLPLVFIFDVPMDTCSPAGSLDIFPPQIPLGPGPGTPAQIPGAYQGYQLKPGLDSENFRGLC